MSIMNPNDIFNALQHGLEQSGSATPPGEVHGTLTGMLCIDNDASPARAVDDASSEALNAALAALREMILEGLFDPDLGFTPLLPGDDVALADRTQALARWCAGFLYGLGSEGGFEPAQLSPEAREVLSDLTELSKAGLTAEDSDLEAAEADYAELVEYVRVAVQMIFLDLRPGRGGPVTREKLH
jgi:uncharacterized protein YgfB (UPF0149 family)